MPTLLMQEGVAMMKEVAIQTVLTFVLGAIIIATTFGVKTYVVWSKEREALKGDCSFSY